MKTLVIFLFIFSTGGNSYAEISQEESRDVIEKITNIFTKNGNEPEIYFDLNWEYPKFVAKAKCNNYDGPKRKVLVSGEVARTSFVTKDTFALILCHEVGHCLGGKPNYADIYTSVEGQADYWSAHSCLAKYFKKIPVTTDWINDSNIDPDILNTCSLVHTELMDKVACIKTIQTSLFAMKNNSSGDQGISILTPSTVEVTKIERYHPPAQCRLDTLVSGALYIPGIDSKNQVQASSRPLCWYNPSGIVHNRSESDYD